MSKKSREKLDQEIREQYEKLKGQKFYTTLRKFISDELNNFGESWDDVIACSHMSKMDIPFECGIEGEVESLPRVIFNGDVITLWTKQTAYCTSYDELAGYYLIGIKRNPPTNN